MKILILFAHPRPSGSVVQRALRAAIEGLDGIVLHDLYAEYPDFAIDVAREQTLLLAHDLIVLQHPLYWYSSPAIIKEWLDLVLEQGWAYGQHGDRLHGKFLMSAISAGGSDNAYRDGGHNRFAIHHLLSPFDQTAHLCGMAWLEPFVVHQGRRLEPEHLARAAEAYRTLLAELRDGHIDPLQRLARGYALPQGFAPRAA